jgi:hypothetical protein
MAADWQKELREQLESRPQQKVKEVMKKHGIKKGRPEINLPKDLLEENDGLGVFLSRHTLSRPVQTYEQLSNYGELVARVDALRADRKTLSEIAATLNAEGFHPPKRSPYFTKGIVCCLLRERGVRTGSLPRSVTDECHLLANEWWLANLAAELAMPIATLHRWQRVGWVTSRKEVAAGRRWAIYADADELLRLRRLRDSPRGWPQPYPTELITPKLKTKETVTERDSCASSPKVLS